MIDTADNKTNVEAETAALGTSSTEDHDVKMREISEKVALRNYYFGTILPPLSIFIFSSLSVIFI